MHQRNSHKLHLENGLLPQLLCYYATSDNNNEPVIHPMHMTVLKWRGQIVCKILKLK